MEKPKENQGVASSYSEDDNDPNYSLDEAEGLQPNGNSLSPIRSSDKVDVNGKVQEDKKQRRLIKNRESAHLSRQRKKYYVNDLEKRNSQLVHSQSELLAHVNTLLAENRLLREQLACFQALFSHGNAPVSMQSQVSMGNLTNIPTAASGLPLPFVPENTQGGHVTKPSDYSGIPSLVQPPHSYNSVSNISFASSPSIINSISTIIPNPRAPSVTSADMGPSTTSMGYAMPVAGFPSATGVTSTIRSQENTIATHGGVLGTESFESCDAPPPKRNPGRPRKKPADTQKTDNSISEKRSDID